MMPIQNKVTGDGEITHKLQLQAILNTEDVDALQSARIDQSRLYLAIYVFGDL